MPKMIDPDPPPSDAAAIGGVSDRCLLESFAAGNLDLFDAFVDRYSRRLHAFLFRQIGDRQWAEDLLQDTFIKAVRAARDGRGPTRDDATAWMFTIARRVTIDAQRAAASRPIQLTNVHGHADQAGAPLGPPPEAATQEAERTAELERALRALPPDQRDAVLLRVYGEMTFAEVAEVVGAVEGTVKSRVYTGLARLRLLLSETESSQGATR